MIKLALGLLIMSVSCGASATTVQSYWRNREALHKFNDKSFYPAYQGFLKALEEDPLNPELHMNLARTFEANEEWEKAEKGYKSALKLLPEGSELRFEALFNLGGVLGKQSKIDEALTAYQACLEMVPDSKEVKTNIELLFQGGGGQGQSKNDDKKDQQGKDQQKKDGEGQDKDQKKNPDQGDKQDQKKQAKPFESKELTPQDEKKILDEIKNQEQAIRAQEYERNAKEAPRGKDW
ncbi:MAG: tetratricopeptide repeat protein [Bdellovibrionales bacterium]